MPVASGGARIRATGHEVELGWPDVPVGRGVAHQAPADFDPVMRPRDLPCQVIDGLDADMITLQGEHPRGFAGRHPAQLGDDHLHHEAPG